MNRRQLLAGAGLLLAAPRAWAATAVQADERADIRRAIAEVYRNYSQVRDKARYRALLAPGYQLLENGELLDVEGDIAFMHAPEDDYHRTDDFDFRQVRVKGDVGYAVYFLTSTIRDAGGTQVKKWLESAIFRRKRGRWLLAVLHSTKIGTPAP